ncbi:MAG: ABC transporter ATP-binding protein [Actinobacteria bacterium]|nr:ABC transporter ATP-binding protein [Actinomycetota bacterium]
MEREVAIKVKDLTYSYKVSRSIGETSSYIKVALNRVSLEILEGEKVSIVGPNGAGKSTLLLSVAGLLDGLIDGDCGSGEIFVFGKKLEKKTIYDIRENIGFVFQDPNDQLFSTSVFDEVSFGLVNYLNKKKDARARDKGYIEKVVRETLKIVKLENIKMEEIPHFLSFGEKKLLALATVLSYNPRILLLDEPSSNLDPYNRKNFIELIKGMDKTIIIATHDLDLAYQLSDRCMILNDGKLIFDGDAREVLSDRAFLERNRLDLPLVLQSPDL